MINLTSPTEERWTREELMRYFEEELIRLEISGYLVKRTVALVNQFVVYKGYI